MDSDALADLLVVLPDWAARLQNIAASKFIDHGTGPVGAVNPGGPDSANPAHIRKIERPKSTPEDVTPKFETGGKKINQKPGATKAKFSSISGPDIYYDGESQKCLFDCWTSLNSKRGALRKEMIAIRRKKVMPLPTANYGYGDSDDDLEADDSDKEDTEEDRLQREEEERQRILEEQKRKEDEKKSKRLEFIDGCLDKAARACESAAYLWLKGEGCMGHVVFITQRMMEAVQRIQAEIAQNTKPAVQVRELSLDEGFGEDGEDYHSAHASEEELHHKQPADRFRGRDERQTSPRPVEVAG